MILIRIFGIYLKKVFSALSVTEIQLLVKLLLSREKYILLTRITNKALNRGKKTLLLVQDCTEH